MNFEAIFGGSQRNALFIRVLAIFADAPEMPLCDYLEGAGMIGYQRAKEGAKKQNLKA